MKKKISNDTYIKLLFMLRDIGQTNVIMPNVENGYNERDKGYAVINVKDYHFTSINNMIKEIEGDKLAIEDNHVEDRGVDWILVAYNNGDFKTAEDYGPYSKEVFDDIKARFRRKGWRHTIKKISAADPRTIKEIKMQAEQEIA